jgi:hypothetical protein
MRAEVGLRRAILDSKLGACWQGITLSALLFVTFAAAAGLTVQWADLEDGDDLLTRVAVPLALLGFAISGLLFFSHIVCLVLRKTRWAGRQHP